MLRFDPKVDRPNYAAVKLDCPRRLGLSLLQNEPGGVLLGVRPLERLQHLWNEPGVLRIYCVGEHVVHIAQLERTEGQLLGLDALRERREGVTLCGAQADPLGRVCGSRKRG